MPVRDVEWFGGHETALTRVTRTGVPTASTVCVSTAVGVALTVRRPALLIGDVPSCTTRNGLLGLARRGVDLLIVVIDNDGGGIFSFLPQATSCSTSTRFEQLFGTPTVSTWWLGAAHDLGLQTVDDAVELGRRSRRPGSGGSHILRVVTDRRRQRRAAQRSTGGRAGRQPRGGARPHVVWMSARQGRTTGAQQGLELGAGLGQLVGRVGVGDDADAGVQARRAVPVELGAERMPTAQVPLPAASTQPTGPA